LKGGGAKKRGGIGINTLGSGPHPVEALKPNDGREIWGVVTQVSDDN